MDRATACQAQTRIWLAMGRNASWSTHQTGTLPGAGVFILARRVLLMLGTWRSIAIIVRDMQERAQGIWNLNMPYTCEIEIQHRYSTQNSHLFESKHLFQNIIFGIHAKDRISFGPPSHSVALNAQVVPSSASTNLSPKTVNDFIFVHALHQLNETSLIYTEHLGKIPKIAHVLDK